MTTLEQLLIEALSIIKKFITMFSENDKAVSSGLIDEALNWVTKVRFRL